MSSSISVVCIKVFIFGFSNSFVGPVRAMDDYDISQLIFENLVVFVCSTTGQGEQPDNMKKFWKFLLKKNLPPDSLGNLRYVLCSKIPFTAQMRLCKFYPENGFISLMRYLSN